MICPNCQSENKDGAKFCNDCGFPLTGRMAAVAAASTSDATLRSIAADDGPEDAQAGDSDPDFEGTASAVEPESAGEPDASGSLDRSSIPAIDVAGVKVGGREKIAVIGGPCSVESEAQIISVAKKVRAAGGTMLRGGAYKPRTSPYAFQGLGTEGILDMVAAREATGLPIVSELMSEHEIDEFEQYVDLVQIGARNMQNFRLLKAVGKMKKPVLLKRGLANTIEEWIMSAEYIMAGGNENVILCERGIRTFEKYTRNTLDLSVVPIIKEKTHLPIIIDPSHATGDWRYVESMSLAAIAAGADGLIIEVHNDPSHALSDGAQSLTPQQFDHAAKHNFEVGKAFGRKVEG